MTLSEKMDGWQVAALELLKKTHNSLSGKTSSKGGEGSLENLFPWIVTVSLAGCAFQHPSCVATPRIPRKTDQRLPAPPVHPSLREVADPHGQGLPLVPSTFSHNSAPREEEEEDSARLKLGLSLSMSATKQL